MQRRSETGIYSIGRQITAALETQQRAQYRPSAQMANHAQSRRAWKPMPRLSRISGLGRRCLWRHQPRLGSLLATLGSWGARPGCDGSRA
jgi:hypothetical protein